MPANFVLRVLPTDISNLIAFDQIRGTVWTGSAQVSLRSQDASAQLRKLPGRLSWRWSLQGGAPRIGVTIDCCLAQSIGLDLKVKDAQAIVSFTNTQITLPLSLSEAAGAPFNTLKLNGELILQTKSLRLIFEQNALKVYGDALVELIGVSTVMSAVKPIGSYAIQVNGRGDVISLKLDTKSGAMRLRGAGEIAYRKWRFDGVASSAPGYELAMSNLLNVVGRRSGNQSVIAMGK
jgi:general secretion pathway protein N